jgi:putative Mn2+ efflux pump MntP
MDTNQTTKLWSAIMFIILGLILLLEEFFPQIDFDDFWPLLLIITGLIMIINNWPHSNETLSKNNPQSEQQIEL